MKKISVVTGCYNELDNVEELVEQVRAEFEKMPQYEFEHIFIDNNSTDGTQDKLRALAAKYDNIKCIFNVRNFGHIRSPYHGLLQAKGDAVISIVADLQDPPSKIPDFLEKWEAGYKVVVGVKPTSDEGRLMFWLRKFYYRLVTKIADVELIRNFTGFGLYDQCVLEQLRKLDEPYPYFRGLISELGYEVCQLEYHQPVRQHGKTKNNFYTNFDMAMLGITSHSKVPLRLATIGGFFLGAVSFVIALIYLFYKLIFWNHFELGMAPVIIGLFFFCGVQLFFIGLVGEYISTIFTKVQNRPLVIERERVGFDE